MPRPKNPLARDHYVYLIHANGHPFYVGHGHAGRLEDRPIYIDRQARLHPEKSGRKWATHALVVADLWLWGAEVFFDQISENQTKGEASAQELVLLRQLLTDGYLLANIRGNPRARPPEEIARAVLANRVPWPELQRCRVVNRYVRPVRQPSGSA